MRQLIRVLWVLSTEFISQDIRQDIVNGVRNNIFVLTTCPCPAEPLLIPEHCYSHASVTLSALTPPGVNHPPVLIGFMGGY